jgi:hypothetical protein
VNPYVTVCAVLIPRISHVVRAGKHRVTCTGAAEIALAVVTFQAKREDNRSAQKPRIRRAVWGMAHFATFYANGWMFKREGASLIDMALQTGFLFAQSLIYQCGARRHAPSRHESAVRVMTITARHESFIHAVFERHRKIRSNTAVAAITELRLSFRQQKFGAR